MMNVKTHTPMCEIESPAFVGWDSGDIDDWIKIMLETERERADAYYSREIASLRKIIHRMGARLDSFDKRLSDIALYDIQSISDDAAEILLREYLFSIKNSGKQEVSLLDLICELNLPSEQIERLMLKLQKEGVREIE